MVSIDSSPSLCSPSDWRLEEKLGATMAEVHGPIPRLNDEIGDQIDRFFTRLPTDRFTQRFNWSLMPHPDLMSRDEWQVNPALISCGTALSDSRFGAFPLGRDSLHDSRPYL